MVTNPCWVLICRMVSLWRNEAHKKARRDEGEESCGLENMNCWKEAVNASCQMLGTKAGPLFLQDHCTTGVVERLRAESGLRAFARLPEREYQLLLRLSARPDTKLTLAYTPTREIVGQVTLVPADGWWQGLECLYEMSIEVSSAWRKLGIARQLVAVALRDETLEEMIVLGLGLSWHWDNEPIWRDSWPTLE